MLPAARFTHQPERSFHHYLHIARRNYREHLRGDTVRLENTSMCCAPLLLSTVLRCNTF
jgi:uncharacterized protein